MKTFIFDVDGTLLDTEKMYMLSLQQVLKERGIDKSYAELAATFGIPSRDALVALKIPDIDAVLPIWGDRTQAFKDQVHIYKGLPAALAQLQADGAAMAIMTSKRRFEYVRDVESIGLDQYFSQAIVAEDAKRGKPAPDPILVALDRLQADPNKTVYVGDTIYDQEAAHAAGVKFGLASWNGQQPVGLTPDYRFQTPAAMVALYEASEKA